MLRDVDDTDVVEAAMTPHPAAARRPVALAAAAPQGRYGQDSRFNSPAVVLTVLLHVALIAAMFLVRNHFVHKHAEKLTVLNLTPDMPPPQTTPEPPKVVEQPRIVAPRPIVQTPAKPTPVQTTADPTPQPVAAPAAVAAIPGPPAAAPAPMSVGVVDKGNIDGNLLSVKIPSYPLESRRKHETGTVVLALTIGVDGRVMAISVQKSSGFSRLDDAALDAVRKWKWKPFQENGQPVMIRGIVPVPFQLQG